MGLNNIMKTLFLTTLLLVATSATANDLNDWGLWNDPTASLADIIGPDLRRSASSDTSVLDDIIEIGAAESAALDIGGVINDVISDLLDQGQSLNDIINAINTNPGALNDILSNPGGAVADLCVALVC
jgi:hypothetical protein